MATQGPNSGGTFANVDDSSGLAWSNTSNAGSSNNSYATATGSGITDFLVATNFGFSIPTGATIDQIGVEVERKADVADTHYENQIGLTIDGSSLFGAVWEEGWGFIPTTDTYVVALGDATYWGSGSMPTVAELNSTSFGAIYQGYCDGSGTISVDHIRITVYYTPGAGGGIPRGPFSKPFRGPFGGSIGW